MMAEDETVAKSGPGNVNEEQGGKGRKVSTISRSQSRLGVVLFLVMVCMVSALKMPKGVGKRIPWSQEVRHPCQSLGAWI